ncbi:MAG: transglycosylase SLT domain-containing protein [Marinilabiliaceae bacterium]|jgi:membrane-bound lytic murein transglycosylase D|nr:LysM peptidoglycan-binding domain-containing protein [Bacteroidales bacterium]MCR5696702.1 transglycosylase SLT domain-containing protein [Marinilabiliaceae bacterium]
MNIKTLVAFIIVNTAIAATAQEAITNGNTHTDSAEEFVAEPDSVAFDDNMKTQVDSLLTAWYKRQAMPLNDLVPDSVAWADSLILGLPDSVYVARLQAMQSRIPLTYNDQVKRFIEFYLVKRRDQVRTMLSNAQYYFPMFEEILDANNMPLELKFLPIIESALNPRALSRVGASGLWQFMYYTGKRYNLDVTSYVDERRDPVKASQAAARYLGDLYTIYGDWQLAIAAYNCGPGNVNRAIARSGGERSFWKLYYHLPRETRGYVPAFIAAAYVMTYAAEHQIYPSVGNLPVIADTVEIVQPLHLEQVSNVLGLPIEMVRDLNPQYRYDIIPAMPEKTYSLRLPAQVTLAFVQHEDSVYARNRMKYFPDNKIIPVSEAKYVQGRGNGVKMIYVVKEGDVPGSIANKFGVRLADLKYWNGMRRNIIRVGQKLVLYIPKNRVDRYKGMAKVAN